MAAERFRVMFYGEVVEGQDVEEVKKKLARVLKMDRKHIENFFSGQPIILKRNVEYQVALEFKTRLEQAGAVCQIKPIGKAAQPSSPKKPECTQQQQYNVVFQGEIAAGQNLKEVKGKLSSLFKLDENKIEKLFTGKPVTVGKNVSYDRALHVQKKFKAAGVQCQLVPVGGAALRKSPQLKEDDPTLPLPPPQIPAKQATQTIRTQENQIVPESSFSEEQSEEQEVSMWKFYLVSSSVWSVIVALSQIVPARHLFIEILLRQFSKQGISIDSLLIFVVVFLVTVPFCAIAYPFFPIAKGLWLRFSWALRPLLMLVALTIVFFNWFSSAQISNAQGVMNVESYVYIVYFTTFLIAAFITSCVVHLMTFLLVRFSPRWVKAIFAENPELRLLDIRSVRITLTVLAVVFTVLLAGGGVYLGFRYYRNFKEDNVPPPSKDALKAMLAKRSARDDAEQNAALAAQGCEINRKTAADLIKIHKVRKAEEFHDVPGRAIHLLTIWKAGTCERGKNFELEADYLLRRNPSKKQSREETEGWTVEPAWKRNAAYLRIELRGTEERIVVCTDPTNIVPYCRDACVQKTKCSIQEYVQEGWTIVSQSKQYPQKISYGSSECLCYTRRYTLERE